jgi:hypothetical protein
VRILAYCAIEISSLPDDGRGGGRGVFHHGVDWLIGIAFLALMFRHFRYGDPDPVSAGNSLVGLFSWPPGPTLP